MSYLLDLVKSFNETELNQFRQLDLIGKEKALRDEYAAITPSTAFDESLLQKKYGFSKFYLGKTNTKLLDRTLSFFSENDFRERVYFLIEKQLYDLLLHNLKLKERKLQKEQDTAELESFYLLAFSAINTFNFNNFPEKLLDYYADCYIKILNGQNEEQRYAVLAQREEAIIRLHQNKPNGRKKRADAFNRLQSYQQAVFGKQWYKAEIKIYRSLSAFYDETDNQKSYDNLVLANAAARKIYDQVEDREKSYLLAMQGYLAVCMSRYKEAVEVYEEAFNAFPVLGTNLFHTYHLTFALLINKELNRAKQVLNQYMSPFLENENARNFNFDILRLYAIFHLLNNETNEAGKYLQRIMQFPKEDFTPYGDALFRFVHNVYITRTGDTVYAADLLKKNLNFIYTKNEIPDLEGVKKMFIALGDIIRARNKNIHISPAQIAAKVDSEGTTRLYCLLLELAAEY